MPDSREEMNRSRNAAIAPSVQQQAVDAVVRAGLVCAVAQAAVIGCTRDGGPLIEIDCLDLAPDTGQAGRRHRIISACTLPGNAGLAVGVEASARP